MWIWMFDLKSHEKNHTYTYEHDQLISASFAFKFKHVDFLYSQEGKVEADRKEVDRMTVKETAH